MEYYVALSKKCERAMAVDADSTEKAIKLALARLKDEGDYDHWSVDDAYVVEHHATAMSPSDEAAAAA